MCTNDKTMGALDYPKKCTLSLIKYPGVAVWFTPGIYFSTPNQR